MEEETIIVVSVLGGVSLLLLVLVAVLFSQVTTLRRRLEDLHGSGRLRVQKLTLENDKNHAFHNPTISPDEELARRGFSMYPRDDAESGRTSPAPRQTGGQLLEELSRELDHRHKRQSQQQEEVQRQQDYQAREQEYQTRQQEYQSRQEQYQSRQPDYQPRQPDYQSRQPDYQSRQPDYQPRQPDHQPKQAPPFLLQSIEENKRKSRQLANPVANGRQSETNPNFIY